MIKFVGIKAITAAYVQMVETENTHFIAILKGYVNDEPKTFHVSFRVGFTRGRDEMGLYVLNIPELKNTVALIPALVPTFLSHSVDFNKFLEGEYFWDNFLLHGLEIFELSPDNEISFFEKRNLFSALKSGERFSKFESFQIFEPSREFLTILTIALKKACAEISKIPSLEEALFAK